MRVEERESLGTLEGVLYCSRSGLEDARGGATPTGNQQPQPPQENSTPQRDRRIMRRTKAQGQDRMGWETRDRMGESGGEEWR